MMLISFPHSQLPQLHHTSFYPASHKIINCYCQLGQFNVSFPLFLKILHISYQLDVVILAALSKVFVLTVMSSRPLTFMTIDQWVM
ncbi:hypothetical protein MtrunA17_Chr1g0166581 [Medicago truncatula]|uniref:Uncharacterized protein n=1 Tax=Medicago truncatula TaxID=3880 RepID=A0A072VGY4_MEDTR|nr:hypothetical protein MTR_1g041585 [Medicago truncatula]RHN78526.1 hypothetical protein MtrunA17_Chr1g0166581 [Medicago truncatula]